MRKVCLLLLICLSPTLDAKLEWNLYKKKLITQARHLEPNVEIRALDATIELVKNRQLKSCVLLGVFNGEYLAALAGTFLYLEKGKCIAIDTWKEKDGAKFIFDHKIIQSEYDSAYKHMTDWFFYRKLGYFFTIIRKDPLRAFSDIKNENFDLLIIDQSYLECYALTIVKNYFERVSYDGYIVLNYPTMNNMRNALVFLLERTELITPFTSDAKFYIFRKDMKKDVFSKSLLK